MSHYSEQREKHMCYIDDQIADFANADNGAYRCPDCAETLEELYNGAFYIYMCPYCEVEVEIDSNEE